ncbi:MAG: hypothetical protein ACI4GV_08505 [Acutalibacteraceae bacterium]
MTDDNFRPFTSFFWGLDTFRSQFSTCEAITNAANAFADYYIQSHEKNIFGGIDDRCILINPDSGEVRITRSKKDVSVKYKAPELITDLNAKDNADTDNFILAILLFRLFFIDHPFEGRKDLATMPFISKKIGETLYGSEPVFVYSPSDTSNRPQSNLSPYLVTIWNSAPESLKTSFTKVFTDGIKNPSSRLSPQQWKEKFREWSVESGVWS